MAASESVTAITVALKTGVPVTNTCGFYCTSIPTLQSFPSLSKMHSCSLSGGAKPSCAGDQSGMQARGAESGACAGRGARRSGFDLWLSRSGAEGFVFGSTRALYPQKTDRGALS